MSLEEIDCFLASVHWELRLICILPSQCHGPEQWCGSGDVLPCSAAGSHSFLFSTDAGGREGGSFLSRLCPWEASHTADTFLIGFLLICESEQRKRNTPLHLQWSRPKYLDIMSTNSVTCKNFLRDTSTDLWTCCLPWSFTIRISYDSMRLNIFEISNNNGFSWRGRILFLPSGFKSLN